MTRFGNALSMALPVLLALSPVMAGCASPESAGEASADAAPVPQVEAPGGSAPESQPVDPGSGSADTAEVEAAAVAADEPPAEDGGESAWREGTSPSGRLTLRWRPVEGRVPRNELFDLDVELRRDGAPFGGARLNVRGWMPDHSHGFVHVPRVKNLGDGDYFVDDLLLHMRGSWQLFFDVFVDGDLEAVEFALEM